MEPIASSGAGAVFRPTGGGPSSELTALLRDGRVLSAEVLTGTAGGTVLLAIGRHSIPAETELDLDPGLRFLVEVEQQEGAGVVLRMLAEPEDEESTLLRALRAVVGEERPLGESLGALAAALRESGAELPELAPLARALAAQASVPPGDPAALRAQLAGLGLGHEVALALLLGARAGHEALERLRGNLKALLLRAEAALGEDGPPELREGVARALAGLRAEQLLNAAREKAGEPLIWSFPFPDGERWATARLAVPPRREGRAGTDEDEPFHVTLGLELSALGPVRADLALGPRLLSVRVLVTRPELLARVRAGFAALEKRLADGRRAVELGVRLGTGREAVHGLEPLDIAFLREHHLMNVAG